VARTENRHAESAKNNRVLLLRVGAKGRGVGAPKSNRRVASLATVAKEARVLFSSLEARGRVVRARISTGGLFPI